MTRDNGVTTSTSSYDLGSQRVEGKHGLDRRLDSQGLHHLVVAQAEKTPDTEAVIGRDRSLSYQDLERRSAALAQRLQERGVGPEVVVGVCVERSAEMIVALLAILRAGGAYLPLDPKYPVERLGFMLADTGVSLVLADRDSASALPSGQHNLFFVGPDESYGEAPLFLEQSADNTAIHLAYLIYTSGSTGRPKGVAIDHSSAVLMVRWAAELFGAPASNGALRCVFAATSICFDLSVFEIFAPLACGGAVVVASNALELPTHPAAGRVTLVNTVPSAIAELLRSHPLPPLAATVVLAGEALPRKLAERVLADPAVRALYNCYGPSEDTTYSTWARIPQGSPLEPAIGVPLPGTEAHVLDARGLPVGPGVEGELYLSGNGLARGYLGRSRQTAERFLPASVPNRAGARMYRTGDLVRRRTDGELEFLGRLDHQVKIRGFRIELGEVESTLLLLPAVRDSVAVAHHSPAGDTQLLAYVVPEGRLTAAELRHELGRRLPAHMVPTRFVFLAALPRTPNGKVDRKYLPEPSDERSTLASPYLAPQTDTEAAVAQILSTLCGIAPVGRRDSFFELGGHSLLATQLVARVATELGVTLPLTEVIAGPTVEALAAMVDSQRGAGKAEVGVIRRVSRESDPPLSPSQERVWFLAELDPTNLAYQFQGMIDFSGELDVAALQAALDAIIWRHEVFRTTFPAIDGRPAQKIHPPQPAALEVVDLSGLGESAVPEVLRRVLDRAVQLVFDIRRLPLIRWILIRRGPREQRLLHFEHHLIHDGWSFNLFLRELVTFYRAAVAGAAQDAVVAALPALEIQFADVAAWQQEWLLSAEADLQRAFWRKQLSNPPPPLALPCDRPRPPRQTYRGRAPRVQLPPTLCAALRGTSRTHDVTLYMTMLTGFHALLGRVTGMRDLQTGCGIANRRRPETEGVMGMLVNNIVLRTSLEGRPTFEELLRRVRATALAAYAHQDLPFDAVVDAVRPERDPVYNPLFQAMFSFHDSPLEELAFPGLAAEVTVALSNRTAKFDLNVIGIPLAEQRVAEGRHDDRGPITLIWEYNSDLFDATTMMRLIAQYQNLLGAAAADPRLHLDALSLLSETEHHQVLHEWNDSARAASPEANVAARVERWAAVAPDRVALAFADQSWSYQALNRRADHLARTLIESGVCAETTVGVALERSPALVETLLAILKARGCYVPLDANYPADRLRWMIQSSGLKLIVTTHALGAGLPEDGTPRLLLEEAAKTRPASVSAAPDGAPQMPLGGDALAYLLFTSGSTGRPKGVAVTHGNILRLIEEPGFARLSPEQVFLLLAPVSFDASTLELWGALGNGSRLAIAEPARPTLEELGEIIERRAVSLLWLTAGLFHQMVEEQLQRMKGVRQLLAGGDVLSPSHVSRVLAELPGTTLINGYGPTENTTFTACHRMNGLPPISASVPIGRAIANTELYVLDPAGGLAPMGVPGELATGGAGLARCYHAQPGLTAERFVPAPRATGKRGERLYRTGDQVRWRPDGSLEFLGRRDHQVKLRGFRIELGEIESALAREPGVRQAVVVLRRDPSGDKRLVAYLVPDTDSLSIHSQVPDPDRALARLRDRLPDYMVPSAVVVLAELPLDANGKLDRRALPAPADTTAELVDEGEQRPVEEIVAGIWSELLGLARIPAQADFFALGGHSLLGTRVVSRLRDALGVRLPLTAIFDHRKLESLAARVERELHAPLEVSDKGGEGWVITPLPATDVAELSYSQERLWLLDRLDGGSALFNMLLTLHFEGELEVALLVRSLRAILDRHAVLRTSFPELDGRPVQAIAARVTLPLVVQDLSALSPVHRAAALDGIARREPRRPFDLTAAPLVRARLVRLGARDHRLFLCLHHLVFDGWSLSILLRELEALYRAAIEGEGTPLPALAVQYADVAAWQRSWFRGERLAGQLAYWRQQLAEPALQDLPTDRPRPETPSHRGARHLQPLSVDLAAGLSALSRRHGATLFMTLLAGLETLLMRHTGETDVIVGTPVAGRQRAEMEGLVGVFLNTLVLRTNLGDDPSFLSLLRRVRDTALGAYAHQDLPFEKLLAELNPPRDPSRTPFFQVFLNLLNFPERSTELPGLSMRLLRRPEVPAKFDLALYVRELAGGLEVDWVYNADLFDATSVLRLGRQFEVLLDGARRSPETPLSRLPLLPASERHQLVLELNDSDTGPAPAEPIHLAFERWAAAEPGALAVLGEGCRLDYGTLDSQANRLARALRESGCGPESLVALCVERSGELVIGLLAILKTGAAFLLVDPADPAGRLDTLMRDAEVSLLLTTEQHLMRLPGWRDRSLSLDRKPLTWTHHRGDCLATSTAPDNLAYVVYTSGSTGKPKGAMISHRTLERRLLFMQSTYRLAPGERVLHKAAAGFDVTVWEILWPLRTGATVVLAQPGGHKDPAYLCRLLREYEINLVHFVPSMLELFLGEPEVEDCRSLRIVLSGGELLPGELLARCRQRLPGHLYNQYGMSEACIDVSYWSTRNNQPAPWVPIGRPYGDTQVHLLDGNLRPVPLGAIGDVWIGGDEGLLRGYRGSPRRTVVALLPDPLSQRSGSRLYRTGDRARRRPDGALVYLTRSDNQIKLRGVRIAPEEIEQALMTHPEVDLAAVVARDQRLVAYFKPSGTSGRAPASEALRQHLRSHLPEHLLPAAFVALENFPKTASGKLDRIALRKRELESASESNSASFEAPATPIEALLAAIWCDVLRLERVGRGDNFFELGGHSLFAAGVAARLRKLHGVELPLRYLFQLPVLSDLAREVERRLAGGNGSRAVVPQATAPHDAPIPLALSQRPFWMYRDSSVAPSTIPIFFRLEGPLDVKALTASLRLIVARHSVLRTTFAERDGAPVQVIHPEGIRMLPVVDLSPFSDTARAGWLEEVIPSLIRKGWNLEHGPLYRCMLLRLAPGEHVVGFLAHHILTDGWSSALFMQELEALYVNFADGRAPNLPELKLQYRDFALWQHSYLATAEAGSHFAYWRLQLRGATEIPTGFPLDHPAPSLPTQRSATLNPDVPGRLLNELRQLAAREGKTLFMVLLAGIKAVLHRQSGQADLTVLSLYANRHLAEVEPMIGNFYTLLPLRSRFDPGASFRQLLTAVQEVTLAGYSHASAIPEDALRSLWARRGDAEPPVSRILFALQNLPALNRDFGGLKIRVLPMDSRRIRFDTSFFFYEGADDLFIRLRYNTDLFEEATVRRWHEDFVTLLEAAVQKPEIAVGELLPR